MSARRAPTRNIPSERSGLYWDKARDFFRLMRDAAQSRNWNGVGLAAVHCAISAADALLVAKAGRRSSSKAHEDAAALLEALVRDPACTEQAKRLRTILREKDPVEYLDRSYREGDALEIQKQVERFMGWAQSLMTR